MLSHSAQMTGATLDAETVLDLAEQMAPLLATVIPYDDMVPVYERTVLQLLQDPNTPAVMVTARDLLATWHLMVAERRAETARDHERNMALYRQRMEARLRAQPREVHSLRELAERDGVALPFVPGGGEGTRTGTFQNPSGRAVVDAEAPDGVTPEEREAERQARINRNFEAWHRLYAQHEQQEAARDRSRLASEAQPTKERRKRLRTETEGGKE